MNHLVEKIDKLMQSSDEKKVYLSILEIFHNMGDTQRDRFQESDQEKESIYLLENSCLPLLNFIGVIMARIKNDDILANLVAKIEFLEIQVWDATFPDKDDCLCKIKELKDSFDSADRILQLQQAV